jgi:hypothetical protein
MDVADDYPGREGCDNDQQGRDALSFLVTGQSSATKGFAVCDAALIRID